MRLLINNKINDIIIYLGVLLLECITYYSNHILYFMLLINEHLWYHVTVRQVSENITKGSKSNTAQEATAVGYS